MVGSTVSRERCGAKVKVRHCRHTVKCREMGDVWIDWYIVFSCLKWITDRASCALQRLVQLSESTLYPLFAPFSRSQGTVPCWEMSHFVRIKREAYSGRAIAFDINFLTFS